MEASHKPKQCIGILGGMGPAATAEFFHLLVKCAQESYSAEQDTDFPKMFMYSLPLEGFDETGVRDANLVKSQLVAGIQELSKFDCGLICIPCNTVHLFLDDMQVATEVPIVSIIEAVVQETKSIGCTKVGILSSQTTKETGLYESAFANEGVEYISVTDEEQAIINRAVHNVMMGKSRSADTSALLSICARMETGGAQALVLGCTELPLALSQKDITLPTVSSLEALARTVLARTYQ